MSPFILLVYLPAAWRWGTPHGLPHNSQKKKPLASSKIPKNRASSFYTQNPIPNQSHLRKASPETPSAKDRKPVFYTLTLLLGYRDANRGHIIENIVFLELLRRDYRVYIGKVGETEVDFVAEKPDDKLYIQVTESMLSPETRERELRPLRLIPDNYEKIVLSMDRNHIRSYDGIRSLYLIDWLLV